MNSLLLICFLFYFLKGNSQSKRYYFIDPNPVSQFKGDTILPYLETQNVICDKYFSEAA